MNILQSIHLNCQWVNKKWIFVYIYNFKIDFINYIITISGKLFFYIKYKKLFQEFHYYF